MGLDGYKGIGETKKNSHDQFSQDGPVETVLALVRTSVFFYLHVLLNICLRLFFQQQEEIRACRVLIVTQQLSIDAQAQCSVAIWKSYVTAAQ